ncbi:hypothetical protein Taro_036248 [Colocasia esculenta]|uniref:Uncharacterized protein n=1 Tax=Colocasia esculenta TaxID=4460 RepID=A0A843WFS4_COLES|nr:hypothetical protein [Colocasia esculenta]
MDALLIVSRRGILSRFRSRWCGLAMMSSLHEVKKKTRRVECTGLRGDEFRSSHCSNLLLLLAPTLLLMLQSSSHENGVDRIFRGTTPLPQGGCWIDEEGFPELGLLWISLKNPEESSFGGFLGLPKEGFTNTLDPLEEFLKRQTCIDGKVNGRRYHAWCPSTMPLTLSQRPEIAAKFFWTEHLWTHSLLRRTGVVGDVAPLEETAETDSKHGD